jgi:2,3-diaminopropionate biosynthesis protein SbnA
MESLQTTTVPIAGDYTAAGKKGLEREGKADARQRLFDRLLTVRKLIQPTPIVPLSQEQVDLYAKLEFLNGVGSIKDRPAFWILKAGIERGEIGPETTIVESSSGNFAAALSTFCRVLGLKFVPVIDPGVSPLYESYLRANCERVVKVTEADDAGGYLKTRLQAVRDLLGNIPNSHWTNQYANMDALAAHYHLTAGEICSSLLPFDYVFLGVSSAGTIAGVSRRLKEHNPNVKIIAVDSVGSVIFGQTPRRRYIPGIGSSISPPLLREALIDDVVLVPEHETVAACHRLLRTHGLFAGGSTGTIYSAIHKYFRRQTCKPRPRVLFLCCDRGSAYLNTIYNPEWVASHYEVRLPAGFSA